MPVKVIIQNASAGSDLRANGELLPDFYRFTRNPDQWSEHVLEFATAAEFNAVSADLMRARGNPPMHVVVTPDADPTLERLARELEAVRAENAQLWEELAGKGGAQ